MHSAPVRIPLDGVLAAALETAPDAMFIANEEGTLLFANSLAEQLFGYDRGALTGAPVETLLPERHAAAHRALRQTYMAQPERRRMGRGADTLGRRKDGTAFPAEVALAVLSADGGALVWAAVRDVSGCRRSPAFRHELLAHLSHELRTPLHAIIGFAELLREGRVGPLLPQQSEFLDDILASSKRMLELLNEEPLPSTEPGASGSPSRARLGGDRS